MSDPVLCIVVYAVFLAAMVAMHFFKTLDSGLGPAWRTALAMGIAVALTERRVWTIDGFEREAA